MAQFLKKNPLILFAVLFLFSLSLFFFFGKEKEARADILIFSPHPDDEVLCCGGTILKAAEEGKNVKIVFLTNGDASESSVLAGTGKSPEELTQDNFINLGRERQEEAIRAAKSMGLVRDDLIFLSYPDGGLYYLWAGLYEDAYLSRATNTTSSPYKLTFNLAGKGYTKENLLSDVKEIVEKYQPKRIYLPHILDAHADHRAANEFVSKVLNELNPENDEWLSSLSTFYYLVHAPYTYSPYVFSREPNYQEDISAFKNKKEAVLKEYRSQIRVEGEEELFASFINDFELFWDMPSSPFAYLNQLEKEWENIGSIMKGQGYNVNFAPVVDIAQDIEDFDMPLTGKKRIYSEDPLIVTELAGATIKGMNEAGIVPVVKHFPGLGRVNSDTHAWLPETETPKEEFYQREFVPFIKLVEEDYDFWIMIDHSIHLSLDNKPSSLSYEIQTRILREELGFEGIIIVDELLAMQALREYAFRQNIAEPYIGEVISQAFAAGADIALFYVPSSLEAREVINETIRAVKQAVVENRISSQQIDHSVSRILAEKEKIFNVPLSHLIEEMSLEEKIAQKLITDVYFGLDEKEIDSWKELLKDYKLAGIHARDHTFINEMQGQAEIPMFVTAQHEGGMVNQYGLNVSTHSAYTIGKEYEFLKKRAGAEIAYNTEKREDGFYEGELLIAEPMDEDTRRSVIDSLIESMDELISAYSDIEQKGYTSPNPNYLSPLTIHHSSSPLSFIPSFSQYEIKPFFDSPISWLRKFPNQDISFQAYLLFKEIFNSWKEEQEELSTYTKDIILNLGSLKRKIEGKKSMMDDPESLEEVRILFLATHPDDEDSEGLAYFKNKFGSETYILLATRGEGGGSPELRTEEMEKAGQILNVNEIHYMDLEDFGYCLSEEEALEKWGKEETVEKIIYFYNLIKPHIIISKNTTSDEHCQHKVFVSLALEAFDRSSGYEWQPLKFYQRDPANDNGIYIDISEKDVATGLTYKEIALESLSQHESQKLGEWARTYYSSWPDKIYYQLSKTKVREEGESIFSGIEKKDL
jgi:LmbE family N-acetylglucosaminyl deacetylase/beta-glucosidase-like glycosyl hydrolase